MKRKHSAQQGRYSEEAGDYASAEKWYKDATENDPTSGAYYYSLSEVLVKSALPQITTLRG